MSTKTRKKAYSIACSTRFRQEIEGLVQTRKAANDVVNAGDLARAVLLLIPREVIEAQPDPGDPDRNDRDIVTVRRGKAGGRTMPRKPRLQVRLSSASDRKLARRALGLALSLDKGWANVMLDESRIAEKIETLQKAAQMLAFHPLPNGVRTRGDALYILGFPPSSVPDAAAVKTRYRNLARLLHPDTGPAIFKDAALRLTQLADAVKILTKKQ